jgi:HTH-type transcriptional regulator, competence development regulator
MKFFGDYIRELREENKLPLRKVAAFLDIDASVLSKIERRERQATKENVIKIAEFFSLNEEQLLNDYFGENIAQLVCQENNILDILKVAMEKIEYIKTINLKQGKLDL